MLDPNALDQLTQLKQSIRADKNLHSGTVRGSQGRFGFVSLDDGREGFLPPDTMARVFPGDRVEVSVAEKPEAESKGKISVELDKLISTELKSVVGQYIVQGKGHFVAVDMPQMQRWLFIPPKARAKAKPGDYIQCRISQHPFEQGKGQVKVTEIIGRPGTEGIEHRVTCLKHRLKDDFSPAVKKQASQIKEAFQPTDTALTDLGFVTIDSASTRDMDDALFARAEGDGWLLSVAIADPSHSVTPDSTLDRVAAARGCTAYLPGKALTMLPPELSYDLFSLQPGVDRPALVGHFEIAADGEIKSYRFEFATVRSQAKLTYNSVSEFLNGNESACPSDTHDNLKSLRQCAEALKQYRGAHMLLMEERDDYNLVIDKNGHISDIIREQPNIAHRIVEEAMLACNRCAGEWLQKHSAPAIYSVHQGFREEKLDLINQLLAEDLPDLSPGDLKQLDGYRSLIQTLQSTPEAENHLALFRTLLQSGQLTLEPAPHMGLGMQHYATVTSPIRRYNDLHNHRAMRSLLAQQKAPSVPDIDRLNQAVTATRQASRDLEQWLFCLWMETHIGKTLAATVFRVTSQGIVVKLVEWGITGFVKMNPKECQFDERRMTLTHGDVVYRLNMPVSVCVDSVDQSKRRINFNWA